MKSNINTLQLYYNLEQLMNEICLDIKAEYSDIDCGVEKFYDSNGISSSYSIRLIKNLGPHYWLTTRIVVPVHSPLMCLIDGTTLERHVTPNIPEAITSEDFKIIKEAANALHQVATQYLEIYDNQLNDIRNNIRKIEKNNEVNVCH